MASNSSSAASTQVAVAIALQSVNTKEASNANCVNERCKILRSLDRVFVFEIVLCIVAPSQDPARFVDLGFWIVRNKEAQEYKLGSQETNHNTWTPHPLGTCSGPTSVPSGMEGVKPCTTTSGTGEVGNGQCGVPWVRSFG